MLQKITSGRGELDFHLAGRKAAKPRGSHSPAARSDAAFLGKPQVRTTEIPEPAKPAVCSGKPAASKLGSARRMFYRLRDCKLSGSENGL